MQIHPENLSLFGGVAGAVLPMDQFEICDGLILRKTYAHVMSPYMLAFRRPERAGQHHPGPWKPARGGIWMDIEIEIALREDARPISFDRLNTLWWTLALLRLSSKAALKLPVVSDVSFSTIADGSNEPGLWPIESLPRQFHTVSDPPGTIEKEHLLWVQKVFGPGAEPMNDPAFGRAFQAFDGAIWAHSAGSALVTIWGSLETLMRPGEKDIGKTMARSLAALLEPPGPGRNRLFGRVKSLYKARSEYAHAFRSPEIEQLLSSFEIGQLAFVSCIDKRALPNVAALLDKWRKEK